MKPVDTAIYAIIAAIYRFDDSVSAQALEAVASMLRYSESIGKAHSKG